MCFQRRLGSSGRLLGPPPSPVTAWLPEAASPVRWSGPDPTDEAVDVTEREDYLYFQGAGDQGMGTMHVADKARAGDEAHNRVTVALMVLRERLAQASAEGTTEPALEVAVILLTGALEVWE